MLLALHLDLRGMVIVVVVVGSDYKNLEDHLKVYSSSEEKDLGSIA